LSHVRRVYGESGDPRQSTGGCGFWNADANLANIRTLELQSTFNGRRHCDNTVGLLETGPPGSAPVVAPFRPA
jgi:hypothetical protein